VTGPHSLFLVRHAVAAERGDAWPDDTERPVTRRGADRMREVVRGLRVLGVAPDLVLTSPLVRAVETAEILQAGLHPRPPSEVCALLAPDSAPARLAAALDAWADRRDLALVGHEPGLGELAAWLIGARTPLKFKKGGVCRIDVPALPPSRTGQLVWLATPRMLRALG
jgi:phosphohistidine phosphatase